MPDTVLQDVPFSFFVSLLREISHHSRPRKAAMRHDKHSSSSTPLSILQRWIAHLRNQFAPLPEGTTAIVFRLLFPEEDARRKYDMQEIRLAAALADCYGIPGGKLREWATEGSSGCLGEEVLKALNRTSSASADYVSPLSLAEVDALLDELASHSGYSSRHVRAKHPRATRRSRSHIIRALYRSLSPLDASFLTQIILKDLRPLLHPLEETHYTIALKAYNSTAVKPLTKEQAMLAWDPTRQMLNVYRVRAGLDDAAHAFDVGITGDVGPLLGTPVEIPKSEKGRGCLHALELLRTSKEVWAEMKYDGERTQIHVEILENNRSRITIFSKSKRDSTLDRFGVHGIIREALGLPHESDSGSGLDVHPAAVQVKANVILDAEMVAWHDDRIDEFWRIRSLVEQTAHGVRHKQPPAPVEQDIYSQASLMTDFSDERHLGLVFFDILFLDSTSLLSVPYSTRRTILESVIRPIPSRAILAERQPIAMHASPNDKNPSLHRVFAECLARPEEGLVLKAGEAIYNDYRFPWVKLKRDYIPGYGDCLDLVVLGVSWEKDRARELRVAPDAYTTFYIGGLHNAEEMKRNPQIRPHFHIYFTAAYGLSRDGLEAANYLIKTSDAVPYHPSKPPRGLPFTFTIFPGMVPPTTILREPLLGELFGAGFTKSPKSRHYELRFARITKIFRPCERSWKDGVDLQTLHKVAKEVIGRDRANKDIDDWSNSVWGKPVSPGATGSLKRKAKADEWEENLIATDRKNARRRGWTAIDVRFLAQGKQSESTGTSPIRALRARTNFASPPKPHSRRSSPLKQQPLALRPSATASTPHKPTSYPSSSPPRRLCFPTEYPSPATSPAVIPEAQTTDLPLVSRETDDLYNFTVLFSNALVFVAAQNPRSLQRWKNIIPADKIVHSLEALFVGCGWDAEQTRCSGLAQRGVVVLDDEKDVSTAQWRRSILDAVDVRRRACVDRSKRKGIWVIEKSLIVEEE